MTYIAINGEPVEKAEIHIPAGGVWWADLDLIEDPELSGSATLTIGDRTLVGTIDPMHNGTFGLRRRLRLLGGAGGWSSLLLAKGYHNDAGVTAREVVNDLIAENGEQLGDFAPERETLGADFAREAAPAARTLEAAIGSAAWWVGLDGVTRVGQRPEVDAAPQSYFVRDANAREGEITLALATDDIEAVQPGTVLSEGLDAPVTVRGVRMIITPDDVLLYAWAPAENAQRGRIAGALRSIARRATDDRLFGIYRYRVGRMVVDRAELQLVNDADGAPPTLGPLSLFPGAPGLSADLSPSTEVAVQFFAGDRGQPVIVGFVGPGGPGFAPQVLTLDASQIKLGGDAATEGASLGTSLKSWADGHVHGYVDDGVPSVTTSPITPPYTGGPGVPDLSPDPSSTVLVAP